VAGSAGVNQRQLSREESEETWEMGDKHGACMLKSKEGDPRETTNGLGEMGFRLSELTDSQESFIMGDRGVTSKTGKKAKKCPSSLGRPKFVQLNEKINEGRGVRKGRGGVKKRKEKMIVNIEEVENVSGGVLEVVLPICPLTPGSGLNFFMEELGTSVPETPLPERSESRCKEADATRLLELGKNAGITFNVIDGVMVKKLVPMEESDEANKVVRERNGGDQ